MTWLRMSESWDDVGCSQKDSHGQPGTARDSRMKVNFAKELHTAGLYCCWGW